jgi:hypothetical protein
MRANEARDLHMYTDASLQNPPPGIIMPEYVEALQRKKGPPADRTLRGQSTDVAGALRFLGEARAAAGDRLWREHFREWQGHFDLYQSTGVWPVVKKLRDGGELTHHDETKYRELAEWVTRCRAEGAAWTTHAATTAKMTFANRRCGCASGKKCALASCSPQMPTWMRAWAFGAPLSCTRREGDTSTCSVFFFGRTPRCSSAVWVTRRR